MPYEFIMEGGRVYPAIKVKLTDQEKAVLFPVITEMLDHYGIPETRADDYLSHMDRGNLVKGRINFYPIVDYVMEIMKIPSWVKVRNTPIETDISNQLDHRLRRGMKAYWTHRILTVFNENFPEVTTVTPEPPTKEQLWYINKYLGKLTELDSYEQFIDEVEV